MATASRHLCRHLSRLSVRSSPKPQCQTFTRTIHPRCQPYRQISSTRPRFAKNVDSETEDFLNNLMTPETPYTVADLDPQERASYEVLSKEEQARYLAIQNHFKAVTESEEIEAVTEQEAQLLAKDIERSEAVPNLVEERDLLKLRAGFWAEDEDDEFGQNEDGDDENSEDLMTSVAESQMEVHREIREYTRIAAWDLPLLLQLTKDFKLPSMKSQPLRFRYTTYLGEHHPAAKKVVVEFTTKDLATATSLTEPQRIKLIKLIGVRYNPSKDLVRMSCEKFPEPAQNKRYLGDLINKIVTEAKDASDLFEDVPLDFRHHKPKKVFVFPEEWKVDGGKGVRRLQGKRGEGRLLGSGEEVVDGREVLETYVRARGMVGSFASPR